MCGVVDIERLHQERAFILQDCTECSDKVEGALIYGL